jgi:hypothetical protein
MPVKLTGFLFQVVASMSGELWLGGWLADRGPRTQVIRTSLGRVGVLEPGFARTCMRLGVLLSSIFSVLVLVRPFRHVVLRIASSERGGIHTLTYRLATRGVMGQDDSQGRGRSDVM